MKRIKKQQKLHEPVMQAGVIEALQVEEIAHSNNNGYFIDATVGMAGHATEVVKAGGRLLGIDMDSDALEIAERRLKKACPASQEFKDCATLVNANFKDIETIAKKNGFEDVDGVLFDLGVSTKQLTSKTSGMSFSNPRAPLDMRMNQNIQAVKASDLLNGLRIDQLVEMLSKVVSRDYSKKLAIGIVAKRQRELFRTVGDFLEVIKRDRMPQRSSRKQKLHPATLPFLALRIQVNSELENLKEALAGAFKLLKESGRLVVISFHSAEDAIVKEFYKNKVSLKEARVISKKPIQASVDEIKNNPKARSAKMRVLQKL
jgi:16S rRNA (cytosine1402-N4)-methyltransferase